MYRRGEKENHLDTILYEIDMLDFAYTRLLASGSLRDLGDSNAYLECFLLHYRNLVEFFGTRKPHEDGTDLRVGIPRKWAPPELDRSKFPALVQDALYKKYWNDLSRYLDHCTTYRAEAPRPWEPAEMYGEINLTLETFVMAAGLTRALPGGVRPPGPASDLRGSMSTASGPGPSLSTPRVNER